MILKTLTSIQRHVRQIFLSISCFFAVVHSSLIGNMILTSQHGYFMWGAGSIRWGAGVRRSRWFAFLHTLCNALRKMQEDRDSSKSMVAQWSNGYSYNAERWTKKKNQLGVYDFCASCTAITESTMTGVSIESTSQVERLTEVREFSGFLGFFCRK